MNIGCWMKLYGVEVEWILVVEYKYKSLNENIMFLNIATNGQP